MSSFEDQIKAFRSGIMDGMKSDVEKNYATNDMVIEWQAGVNKMF